MAPRKSTHESLYLKRLKFDPKLSRSFFAKYLTNFRYVFLLILIIAVVGTFSYINLPRRLNPQIKIPIVSIATVLPGAGPSDVESLVTIPMEDALSGLPNVTTVTSTSQENVSIITIEFSSGVSPDKAKDDVQSQVDSVTTLPTDAKTPKVQKLDFENAPVWNFLVASNADNASLISFSESLKDKIKNIASVKDVTLSGNETQEIQILIKPETQKTYNVDSASLSQIVSAAVPSHPSGTINTENSSFSLTIDPTIKSVEDLRNLEVIINGQPVKLSAIAQVELRSSPNQTETFFLDPSKGTPQRAIAFSVFKTESANIDRAVIDTQKVLDAEVKNYGDKFKVVSLVDTSQLINKQF
ncbi:efflux RND transporter permease subunit, partial [Candidatus Curtissbacteria bacterium]|nr:efflux RND transporter permease subunit [Candidatus Curtissbacteria bacterium]